MSRGLGIAVFLALILPVVAAVSPAQTKPAKARPTSSQQNVPAPHWGSA